MLIEEYSFWIEKHLNDILSAKERLTGIAKVASFHFL